MIASDVIAYTILWWLKSLSFRMVLLEEANSVFTSRQTFNLDILDILFVIEFTIAIIGKLLMDPAWAPSEVTQTRCSRWAEPG